MKKLIIAFIVLMLSVGAGMSYAAGGKNHGTKGKGKTYTGSTSKGNASQIRAGQ